ncbi:MAG: hypothetical protein M1814_006259 [Vezdaea aestivalis]|nr:MAG: hypothetical protein M1814_006259 [Vezdaea aestivalis]
MEGRYRHGLSSNPAPISTDQPKNARRRLSPAALQSIEPRPMAPMAIRNTNRSWSATEVPPALPPPRHAYDLQESPPPFQWETNGSSGGSRDTRHSTDKLPSITGTLARKGEYDDPPQQLDQRRESCATIRPASPVSYDRRPSLRDHDETYGTMSSTASLSGGQRFEPPSKNPLSEYDRSLISILDSGKRRTPPNGSLRPLITNGSLNGKPFGREDHRLKPLSATDSAISSWANSPDTASPLFGGGGSRFGSMDFRSGMGSRSSSYAESDYQAHSRVGSLRTPTSACFDEPSSALSRSHHVSSDHHAIFEHDSDFPHSTESDFGKLALREKSPRQNWAAASSLGTKRRRSPAPDCAATAAAATAAPVITAPGFIDSYARRPSGVVRTPFSHSHRVHPKHGSISSTSSMPRSGSWASAADGTGSITSYSSSNFDRSPGALSSAAEGTDTEMSYMGNSSVGPSPRGSLSIHHPLTDIPRPLNDVKLIPALPNSKARPHVSKSNAQFACECCPKKTRKFNTREELNQHEAEKQYLCSYCSNRFKNKNEAERHQNSLHLRQHSWSCAALTNIEGAFQSPKSSSAKSPTSSSTPSSTSNSPKSTSQITIELSATCGYCGLVMPNNPPDWSARRDHLIRAHKYKECNQSKKFFRADHFRQHLKHSHAGSSGKWTNLLETACCRDEPCPERKEPVKLALDLPLLELELERRKRVELNSDGG